MSDLAIKLIEQEKQAKTGYLDLGNCGLKTIPKEIFELSELKTLDLRNNQISDIKPLFPFIKQLISVDLKNNPITNPPMSIIEQGKDAIINWFEQKEKYGEAPLFESKLMILGQGGVGKTTCANLQLDPNYEVRQNQLYSTLGIVVNKGKEFNHVKIKGQKIKAHLWDFGGQNIQKTLHQFFITENCLYILMTDKRAENANFDYWLQIINMLGPKSSVIVLENPIQFHLTGPTFDLLLYKNLFKELDLERIEVNLSETRGTDKTKWQLMNELIEEKLSKLEIVNRPVPKIWSLIRDELENEKNKEKKYITKDRFYEISSKLELTNNEADLCLNYLRSLGDLAYFDELGLCSNIFIDPNWLTQGLYYILSDSSIYENKGKFTRQQAYKKWDEKGYNESEKAMLLSLLLKDKFDICYELPNEKGSFITPLLLPPARPSKWELETNLIFRYQYGFMPYGIFSRFIVQVHEKIDSEIRWKTGLRLLDKNSNTRAEIRQFNDSEEHHEVIEIKINGDKIGCKNLLQFIINAVEKIHKYFKKLSYKEMVACSCDVCKKLIKADQKPSFYDYKKLIHKIENQKYYEECERSNYKDINIGQILSDFILENATKNQPINPNIINITVSPNVTAIANSKSEATNTVSIEIENILADTKALKEDIERERKILQKKNIDNDEIDLAINDVEVVENAIKEIETAQKQNQQPPIAPLKRFKGFIKDLSDENSTIRKVLKGLRKGKDYAVNLAETYNKIAENLGMPSVPKLPLEAIKAL